MMIDQRQLTGALKRRVEKAMARKEERTRVHRLLSAFVGAFTIERIAATVAVAAFAIGVLFATFAAAVAMEELLDFIHGEKKSEKSSFSPLRNGTKKCYNVREVENCSFSCFPVSRTKSRISAGPYFGWGVLSLVRDIF